jgi:hypothetical protein
MKNQKRTKNIDRTKAIQDVTNHETLLSTDTVQDATIQPSEVKASGCSLTNDENEWLTSVEAARFLKISIGTLRNQTSNGQLPYYKYQRLNRYRKSQLLELLLKTQKGEI